MVLPMGSIFTSLCTIWAVSCNQPGTWHFRSQETLSPWQLYQNKLWNTTLGARRIRARVWNIILLFFYQHFNCPLERRKKTSKPKKNPTKQQQQTNQTNKPNQPTNQNKPTNQPTNKSTPNPINLQTVTIEITITKCKRLYKGKRNKVIRLKNGQSKELLRSADGKAAGAIVRWDLASHHAHSTMMQDDREGNWCVGAGTFCPLADSQYIYTACYLQLFHKTTNNPLFKKLHEKGQCCVTCLSPSQINGVLVTK